MMNKIVVKILIIFFTVNTLAQESKNENSILQKGVKYKFDEDGKSTLVFHFGTQLWARYINTNPSTVNPVGEDVSSVVDFGIRRARISVLAKFLEDKYIVYTHLGMNGQKFLNGNNKPQMFFHDVWGSYRIVKEKLYLGFGLHGWAGISRLSNFGSVKSLMIDHPSFSHPNLSKTDQVGRQLGVFIKGNLINFNYRFALSKPFQKSSLNNLEIDKSKFWYTDKFEYKGYLFYCFLDKEISTIPYVTMTYLGKKKLFNIGAGFDYTPDAMASLNTVNDTVIHDKLNLGVDLFLEYPFSNSSVLTTYSLFQWNDFGTNYTRVGGVMNPYPNTATGTGNFQEGGNSQVISGTGSIFYMLAGYLFPESFLFKKSRLQAIAGFTYKNLQRLNDPAVQYDFGFNYFISGHHSKITLQYSSWPVFQLNQEQQIVTNQNKGNLILQLHFFI